MRGEGPNPTPSRPATPQELYWSGLISYGEYVRRLKGTAIMSEMRPPTKETKNYSMFGNQPHQPDRIDEQERRGSEELRKYSALPVDGCSTPEEVKSFTDLGFDIHDVFPEDELFRGVSFPPGWTKHPSSENPDYWTDIIDETGAVRFLMFYKAASYDRRARVRSAQSGEKSE